MFLTWLSSLPQRLSGWPLRGRALFAFALGALSVLAMPPYCWWLILGLTVPLFYALLSTTHSAKTAFLEGWLFAFGYFGLGLMWIGNALLVEGNPFSWVWPLAIAGLPALLGFFYAIPAALLHRYTKIASLSGWAAMIGTFALSEWLRGHMFTGFPWNLFGYTWNSSLPLAQSVSLVGSYGLTLLTLFWAMIPALLWIKAAKQQVLRISIIGGISFAGLLFWGYARLANHPVDLRSDMVVRLVQPNIPQEDKWDSRKANDNARKLLDLTVPDEGNAGATTLVIWPETAISETFLMHEHVQPAIREVLGDYKRPVYLMTGLLRREISQNGDADRYYNSLATYDSQLNQVTLYDKSHLVPFGEYIPYQNLIPLNPFVNFGGFEKGAGPQTQMVEKGLHISPLVCYEIIFPHATTDNQSLRPDLIVNVTNDAWYGDSAGPRQHLAMTRFRAIEEGVAVARAANTGISGLFDPYGRLLAHIDLDHDGAKNIALPRSIERVTYSKMGDLLFFLLLTPFLVLIFLKDNQGQ